MSTADRSDFSNRALLALRLMTLGLALVVVTRTQADPDLWGHVLFGRDIVTQHAIPATDHYSFTSDLPWINHEWLSESAMYMGYATLGPLGLGVLKIALVLCTIAMVMRALRRSPMAPVVHDALVFLTVAGIAPLATHMRPEMFSLALFASLLTLLRKIERGSSWPLVAIPPLMVIWANFHGGWLVGMSAFGLWSAARFVATEATGRARLQLATAVAGALGGTLLNPYGVRLWAFLRATVGMQRADISEWLPIYQLLPGMIVLWLLVATIALASTALSSRRPSLSSAAIVCMLGVASFRVGRLIGFFVISVVVLLAPQIASAWQRRKLRAKRPERPPTRLATAMVLGAAIIVLAGSSTRIYNNLSCVQMEDDWSPEPAAALFVNANELQGRMLTWFDWGEYAIWHFSPRIRVSLDGRRETVYSETVRAAHLGFFFNVAANRHYATDLNADYIWLPKQLPVVPTLAGNGWIAIFAGSRSVIFGRSNSSPTTHFPHTFSQAPASRCFPGP
jgi:hypothetical protein